MKRRLSWACQTWINPRLPCSEVCTHRSRSAVTVTPSRSSSNGIVRNRDSLSIELSYCATECSSKERQDDVCCSRVQDCSLRTPRFHWSRNYGFSGLEPLNAFQIDDHLSHRLVAVLRFFLDGFLHYQP